MIREPHIAIEGKWHALQEIAKRHTENQRRHKTTDE